MNLDPDISDSLRNKNFLGEIEKSKKLKTDLEQPSITLSVKFVKSGSSKVRREIKPEEDDESSTKG